MCGGAVAQRTKYNSSDAVSGYTLHVAEEGQTLSREQQRENWALGGADEPEYFKSTTLLGSDQRGLSLVGNMFKESMRSQIRTKWYDDRKADWNKYYANIGKDYKPSLEISSEPREQRFYGSDGSTWKD